MGKKLAVEGDTVSQDYYHCPGCSGSGTYSVAPVTLQTFVFISGKLVIPDQQGYGAHCGNSVNSSCLFVFITGMGVVRDQDRASSSHDTSPLQAIGQGFVFA